MPRSALPLVVSCLAAAGCAGGQTGEITGMGRCEVVIDEPAVAALEPATLSRLDAIEEPHTASARWIDSGTETELSLAVEIESDSARLYGPGDCGKFLRIDASISASTGDGRLDLVLPGVIEVNDLAIVVQGRSVVDSLGGDPLVAPEELSIWVESQPPSLRGEIALSEMPIATF
jgi:hypothetical protein